MKPKILVVDDDMALAEMLTIVLRGEGFDPHVVGDGTQALSAVREIRPDLVLLDLMLPGMNGIDVCRVLRADSGVPIVMLTAKTDTVDVVLGLESGADDYIVKPFKPKELVARVRARRAPPPAEPPQQETKPHKHKKYQCHKVAPVMSTYRLLSAARVDLAAARDLAAVDAALAAEVPELDQQVS